MAVRLRHAHAWLCAAACALLLLPPAHAGYAIVNGPAQTYTAASLSYPSQPVRDAAVAASRAAAFGPNPANVTLSCALLNLGVATGNGAFRGRGCPREPGPCVSPRVGQPHARQGM
jgi:hypothetical protein